ncbi:uncharacterized protein LOC114254743 isoform X2 [Monomorium pharaonis]|uniref:uncharacterized protein LOC114254743 isoform X2 n=1 Tax=Monomorium pharaonis TaxID=307658 RepID=UPI0017468749|nr:uncharacterized protein LOC114254743 isoform X2 [Monomorium pharaonis]
MLSSSSDGSSAMVGGSVTVTLYVSASFGSLGDVDVRCRWSGDSSEVLAFAVQFLCYLDWPLTDNLLLVLRCRSLRDRGACFCGSISMLFGLAADYLTIHCWFYAVEVYVTGKARMVYSVSIAWEEPTGGQYLKDIT